MSKTTKDTPIKNDCEYFSEYGKLYNLLIERDRCLKRVRNGKVTDGTRKALSDSVENITKCRNEFWKRVKAGKENGKEYLFEKIAGKCGFTETEKRVILFFVSLTNMVDKDALREVNTVVDLFDFSGSVLPRAKLARVIEGERLLTKREILQKKTGDSWEATGYCLNDEFYQMVMRVLNGENLNIFDKHMEGNDKKQKGMEKKKTNITKVGTVREAAYTFDDVIAPEETIAEVKMFLDMARGEESDKFGVFNKIKTGRGTGFLFYGPSGTGKSMMAEAAGSFVGKRVLKVEYPKILSSLLGDTDKQIAQIFKTATEEDLVIILDEADSLLYDRKYAQWEHDLRFVNDMLQEIENYEGIIVLTTNIETSLDPALERRLAYKVKFDLPKESSRGKIWERHMPTGEKISADIDYDSLSRKYEFSGGNIKNAVLNAARAATSAKREKLTMQDLVNGAEMERKGMFSKEKQNIIEGFACRVNM